MNRKIVSIAAVSVLAVLAVWYLALWKPAGHQLAAARQSLSTAQSQQSAASAQHGSLLAQAGKLPTEESKAAALTAAAPGNPDLPGLIDAVDSIAAATGVTWQSESQTQPTAVGSSAASGSASSASSSNGSSTPGPSTASASRLSSLTLNFSVTGTYGQVLNFVERLQNMPRLVVVTSLSLAGGQAAPAGAPGAPPVTTPASSVITSQIIATAYEDPTPIPPVPHVKS